MKWTREGLWRFKSKVIIKLSLCESFSTGSESISSSADGHTSSAILTSPWNKSSSWVLCKPERLNDASGRTKALPVVGQYELIKNVTSHRTIKKCNSTRICVHLDYDNFTHAFVRAKDLFSRQSCVNRISEHGSDQLRIELHMSIDIVLQQLLLVQMNMYRLLLLVFHSCIDTTCTRESIEYPSSKF